MALLQAPLSLPYSPHHLAYKLWNCLPSQLHTGCLLSMERTQSRTVTFTLKATIRTCLWSDTAPHCASQNYHPSQPLCFSQVTFAVTKLRNWKVALRTAGFYGTFCVNGMKRGHDTTDLCSSVGCCAGCQKIPQNRQILWAAQDKLLLFTFLPWHWHKYPLHSPCVFNSFPPLELPSVESR